MKRPAEEIYILFLLFGIFIGIITNFNVIHEYQYIIQTHVEKNHVRNYQSFVPDIRRVY